MKLVTEEKLSLPEAARRLPLPTSTLGNWVKAYKADRLRESNQQRRHVPSETITEAYSAKSADWE